MPEKQMASSHTMKRFLRAFHIFRAGAFRWVLQELFHWRLQQKKPRMVVLTLDTMVMDNDEALQREGCDPTYKKVKGFQPLQLIGEDKIVDAIFRPGKRHRNYGHDVEKMIRGMVTLIRTRYDASVPILVRLDAAFFDEKNLALLDDLGIAFLAMGKIYEGIKPKVAAIPKKQWRAYDNGHPVWSYARFSSKCEKSKKAYRALYPRPPYEDQPRWLEFAPPDNIIVTNLVPRTPLWERMPRQMRKYGKKETSLIYHHHPRGADELPQRGLKEFGRQQLPFKRFAANQAYYYLLLISFFLFEIFKEDNLQDILPLRSYATTLRKLVDFAAKVVRSGHEVILKVPPAIRDRLKLELLWTRCQKAAPIPLQT